MPGATQSLMTELAFRTEDYDRAAGHMREAFSEFRTVGRLGPLDLAFYPVHHHLLLLGCVEGARGNDRTGVALLAACQHLSGTMDDVPSLYGDWWDRALDSARLSLDPETFEAAWDEGAAMTVDGAVAFALQRLDQTRT